MKQVCGISGESPVPYGYTLEEVEAQRDEVIHLLQAVLHEHLDTRPCLIVPVISDAYYDRTGNSDKVPCRSNVPPIEHLRSFRDVLRALPLVHDGPRNYSIIRAEIKLLEMQLREPKSFGVRLSIAHTEGLLASCFIQEVDTWLGGDPLFKKSVLRLENSCKFESDVITSQGEFLSAWALEASLLAVFVLFESIGCPLKALLQFLAHDAQFVFANEVITAYEAMGKDGMIEARGGGGDES